MENIQKLIYKIYIYVKILLIIITRIMKHKNIIMNVK